MSQVGIDGLSSITAGEKIQMDFSLSHVTAHKCLSKEARLCFCKTSDSRAGMKRDLEYFPFVDKSHFQVPG